MRTARRAEVAFVVHETTRHLGMAGFLLGELAAVAKQRGYHEFWASVLPDNRAMAGLFLAAGGTEAKAPMDERTELRHAGGRDPADEEGVSGAEKNPTHRTMSDETRTVGVHYDACLRTARHRAGSPRIRGALPGAGDPRWTNCRRSS